MTEKIPRSSLDAWILAKHGLVVADRPAVRAWQLDRVRALLAHARDGSPFYRDLYRDLDLPRSLEDFASYPLMEARDLIGRGRDLLCVHPGEIARIVTLMTSGTTQDPKRVFFTQEDLDLTLDFFHHGMKTMTGPGDRALILFPWQRPDSVGALLSRALERLGLVVHCKEVEDTVDLFSRTPLDLVCGPASWVLSAAELNPGRKVRAVLTSSEYLDPKMRARIASLWGSQVFDHYGMTETGLGGAVECQAHQGMHIRENDLYFEVLGPEGQVLPPGREGDLVVTTLTRRGMPFIRYRTGDRGVIEDRTCPCGSPIPRILWVRRIRELIEGGST